MKRLMTFLYAVAGGVCISIGGTAFLAAESKAVGALFFVVGLFTICTFGYNLYTGKICYVFERDRSYAIDLPIIWLGNLAGALLFGSALRLTRCASLVEKAVAVSQVKLSDDLLSIFLLAIFCDILIFIAVDGFGKNPHELGKYIALFFGVSVFVFCGFEHCVANMFYFTVAGVWDGKTLLYIIVMTLGNSVGGVLLPLLRMWKKKSEERAVAKV